MQDLTINPLMICPYCNKENKDSNNYSDTNGVALCPACNKPFIFNRKTYNHYTTKELEI